MQPGTRLAHYEILAAIGKGGMGEVYRARDTKLGRDVAIKVLPAEFARDPERLARLEREARALAALNHPNIAAIHGLEESDETRFLVLELVEGDTLADLLERGRVPVAEALKLALQIAEALEAAHGKGVIHRDLKPANIKITPEGRVKVLDFGLAKAFDVGRDVNLSNSPTLSLQATQQGVILGTAGYMSPEQARGEAVEQTGDIWALGCVLFEMLSGRQTWKGRTVTDIIAALVAREPDWSQLPSNLPSRVRFLLERCLEKEPKDRCSRASEVHAELERAMAELEKGPVEAVVRPQPGSRRTVLPWIAAIALAAAVGITVWLARPLPENPVTRFAIDLPETLQVSNPGSIVALSPDGRRLVYSANGRLYQRGMDQMEASPIPGTEGATGPFFSPNGASLAFFVGPQLMRVALTGGAPVVLATTENAPGLVGDWDTEGRIFFGQNGRFPISQIPETGGQPQVFAELSDEVADLDFPDVLPGGEWVLFSENHTPTNWADSDIVAQNVSTGERKVVLSGGYYARYVPTGHIVYALNGNLYAVAFDSDRVEVTGTPVEVVSGVAMGIAGGIASFAVSSGGTLAYLPGTAVAGAAADRKAGLVWVDREGNADPIPIRPDNYTFARLSPDGTKVALVVGSVLPASDPLPDIWIFDLETQNLRQLTFDTGADDGPLWSPDGDTIYFRSWRSDVPEIYAVPVDGGEPVLVEAASAFGFPMPWSISPDGDTLNFTTGTSLENIDIASVSLSGEESRALLSDTAVSETEPVVSPNGAWIADMEAAVGTTTPQINIRPFPDVGRALYPVGEGLGPVFARNGSELFYWDGANVVSVPLEEDPFRIGTPEPLFGGRYWYGVGGPAGTLGRAWDVDPNADRFLMITTSDTEDAEGPPVNSRIYVVLNWQEELKERVPVP